MKIAVFIAAAVVIVALSVAGPIIVRYARGFVAGAIWQWRELRKARDGGGRYWEISLSRDPCIHGVPLSAYCAKCAERMGETEPSHELIVMRLADMTRVHPDQIVSRCSECGEKVGVYPSGQRVMREIPTIKLFCQVCRRPNEKDITLAPGAELEPMQSRKRSE